MKTLPISPIHSSPHFFFNDTATTEIYTLSLHDALPIFAAQLRREESGHDARASRRRARERGRARRRPARDRKSTRLNSSHVRISYAVFCLKKKNKSNTGITAKSLNDRMP